MAKPAPGGAPMWMATFADLMSLLLTLFVLLLTFAEMDVVKYKAIAGSMSSALGTARKDKLAGIVEIDGTLRKTAAKNVDMSKREEEITETPSVSVELPVMSEEDIKAKAQAIKEKKAEELAESLSSAMEDEMKTSGVSVERSGSDVIIRFPSSIAFPSGSSSLNTPFKDLLTKLAPLLQTTPGGLVVSGHTDNIPVGGGKFQSNWDLSASRATSVVHDIIDNHGVAPSRVTVQGYGDSRPIDTNETIEGRSNNRRVELMIVAPADIAVKPKTIEDKVKGFYEEAVPKN